MNTQILAVALALLATQVANADSSHISLRPDLLSSPQANVTASDALLLAGASAEDPEEWNLFGVRPANLRTNANTDERQLGQKDRAVAVRVTDGPASPQRRAHLDRSTCQPMHTAVYGLFGGFITMWAVAALLMAGTSKAPVSEQLPSLQQRDPRWDRVRFHLMTIIIWTHWVGKWGMEKTKAGWVVLNWGFAIHVVSFVFLSGVFSTRYAMKVQERGLKEVRHVMWNCLDVFLVYVIFSWLRGLVALTLMEPHLGASGIVVEVLRGTFTFHQAPWYLSALIVWRLCVFVFWRTPGLLVVSLCIGALCPYKALQAAQDPFAMREAMHYLPFFALGLLCGEEKLERIISAFGKRRTALVGLAALIALAVVISNPLGPLFKDHRLRWVMLKKDVPPPDVGGYWLMLLLYAAKAVSMIFAMMLFVAPTSTVLDRAIENAGTRSMMVYMVHMVFIMVPGEWLCPAGLISSEHSGLLNITLLFILAFAVNLLCGSDFTACIFQPLMEPLSSIRSVSAKVKRLPD